MKFHYVLMADYTMQRKLLMQRLRDTGLTPGQPKVLAYLSENDGVSQGQIARACFLEAGTMATVMDGMEKQNLVERTRCSANRRAYQVRLTEKGRAMACRVNEAFAALEREIFSDIGEENGRALTELLSGAYEVLQRGYNGQEKEESA